MKGIVIDASITLSWCFPDEQTQLSINVLDRLKAGEQAVVPAFWCVEVVEQGIEGSEVAEELLGLVGRDAAAPLADQQSIQ